jgi:hypothetical protein
VEIGELGKLTRVERSRHRGANGHRNRAIGLLKLSGQILRSYGLVLELLLLAAIVNAAGIIRKTEEVLRIHAMRELRHCPVEERAWSTFDTYSSTSEKETGVKRGS